MSSLQIKKCQKMGCKKKLKLYETITPCKCKLFFCSEHRVSKFHDCTFDYHTDGQSKLYKDNPIVVSEKVKKI